MMYQIAYNGEFIYGEDEDKTVLDPSLEIELNAAGTLTITIPVENEAWSQFEVFRGEVVVYEGDDVIWFGRPLQIVRDWLNRKVVTCEGALAYFNDSLQVTKEYKQAQTPLYTDTSVYPGKTGFINDIIGLHNDQVESNRKIYIGEIDIDNELVYRYVDYETTADILQQMCLDTNGGYFILRKAVDETTGELRNYLDWRKEVPYSTDQPVQFGVNLLDLNQDLNGADICTVLLPTGENDLNISTVQVYSEDDPNHPPYHIADPEGDVLHSSGSVYMTHMQGYKRFGRVVKTKDFSAIADKNSLFQKAAEWLNEQNTDVTTIECSVADLHYLNEYSDYGKLRIGQKVQVGSAPHDLSKELPIYKVSMKLDSGAKTITLGTPPKRELTDIVKNNGGSTRGSSGATGTGGGSDSSGGGSGSTYIPVTDVKVKMPGENNFATVVKKRIAQIDLSELGGGDVTDVKVNDESVVDEDGVANITIPAPPDVPVQDVKVNDESVVDENGVAKLNSSDFGTKVVANPAGTPTDDLETIQIGNDIFNVVGSGSGGTVFMSDYYSEDEQVVGRWTDGKPLYQKMFDLGQDTTISSSSWTDTSILNTFNIDKIIAVHAMASDGTCRSIAATAKSSNYIALQIAENSQRNVRYFVLQYTKTTDAAGTGPTKGNLIYLPALYSKEEREVGVWHDGKPMYQRTFEGTSQITTSGDEVSVQLDLQNVDKICNFWGGMFNVTEGVYQQNRNQSGLYFAPYQVNAAGLSRWKIGSTWASAQYGSDMRYRITVQYTKTTDQPGSGTWTPEGQLAHHYSTSEHIVGTWIDGSTVYEKSWDFGSNILIGANTWDTSLNIDSTNINIVLEAHGNHADGTMYVLEVDPTRSSHTLLGLRAPNQANIRYFTLRYTKS